MFLLDTNILSELRRPRRADPNVLEWAAGMDIERFYLSVITIMEIAVGALRLERKDPEQADALRRWIDQNLLPDFNDRLVPVDLAVARQCARLHVPDPRAERDALIAATALVHDMTVVTRNVRDFAPLGVRVLNPWLPGE
ncbi:type II toxin-antitoxin system VapC family toxin [Rhodoplanes azumiensis]|uniref:Ribonuclease VapC n=1 Tax=Rhodoplanes azumiensis TaxID=1897628 RepID=A0ABW5AJJ4_9BRAD